MKRHLRKRTALTGYHSLWNSDEEKWFADDVASHFPAQPVRSRRRHDRAEVRHQLHRARGRAARRYKPYWNGVHDDDLQSLAWRQKWIYQFATDRKPCSCWMCGHVRDREGMTIQEHRIAASERQEELDLRSQNSRLT